MRFLQLRNNQVKCNFCMQWMSLSTQIKYNINVCDQCLDKGCQQHNLQAISSKGQIYQLYMVKKNAIIHMDLPYHEQIQLTDQNQQIIVEQEQKIEFLQEIDGFRNSEIKQILSKWNSMSNFLRQKQTLQKQQIQYLKDLIAQNQMDNKRINHQFTQNVLSTCEKDKSTIGQTIIVISIEEKIHQQNLQNFLSKRKQQLVDKQNITSKSFCTKDFQNFKDQNDLKLKIKPKDKKRQALQQQDLNIFNINLSENQSNNLSQNSSSNLSENQRSNLLKFQCLNQLSNQSLSDQPICAHSLFLPISTNRSSHSSFYSTIQKSMPTNEQKRVTQARVRIFKYLQQNYQSCSLTRLMIMSILEAFSHTTVSGRSFQIISYSLNHLDFRGYLEAFDWKDIQILKLVKTKLSDQQLQILSHFIQQNHLNIKILVLTNNRLTQKSINILYQHDLQSVRQVYLGKNNIQKWKAREKIQALSQKYSLYL